MPNPRTYTDLNEHLTALKKEGLLHIIDIPINKDKHLHPLVRWQFRGGIATAERKGFHFTNVTDGAGTKYGGSCAVGRADSKFSKESIAVVAAPSPVTL